MFHGDHMFCGGHGDGTTLGLLWSPFCIPNATTASLFPTTWVTTTRPWFYRFPFIGLVYTQKIPSYPTAHTVIKIFSFILPHANIQLFVQCSLLGKGCLFSNVNSWYFLFKIRFCCWVGLFPGPLFYLSLHSALPLWFCGILEVRSWDIPWMVLSFCLGWLELSWSVPLYEL